jgi:hypothetical protein
MSTNQKVNIAFMLSGNSVVSCVTPTKTCLGGEGGKGGADQSAGRGLCSYWLKIIQVILHSIFN